MIKSIKEERYRWIKPIIDKEIRIVDMVKVCSHSESSIKRWLKLYKQGGIDALEPKSTEPKTQKKETNIEIKEQVIALRKETGLCALKLKWRLEKQGVTIHERTIGKILKKEGLTRKYRVKKVKYKYIKAKRKPGELVEIDVKHVPGPIKGLKYYQYTAIDTSSRWRHLEVFDSECSYHSIKFLKIVIDKFPHKIQAVKTDNGSIFTNYYTGTNKRSDMTIKKIHALDQFKTFHELRTKIRVWNEEYNNLEHCGLSGKTPNEMLNLR